jgi:UDP-N-acetylglucosamine 1-carboxyvinyltransferase
VRVCGAKNSALPLIIAALLSEEEICLSNVPDLEDISVLLRLLRSLGAESEYDSHTVRIKTPSIKGKVAPYSLVKALRASFWVLGPLLARAGQASVALPGGDAIGTRPVDLHLDGLRKFGAEFNVEHGVVIAEAPGGLRPAEIHLDYPSVGATHHLLMTAALIPGETRIYGAAREPEIVDLAELLCKMGARISGIGESNLLISGESRLRGASHEVLGDRIEAVTYLLSGAVTGGKVSVDGLNPETICSSLDLLERMGCRVLRETGARELDRITISGPERLKAVSFETSPYPGIATDVQPLFMAALTRAVGESVIHETVFESRFGHAAEYRRFGADIRIDGRLARVWGVDHLSAAPVEARDIRAAAGAVLMGLCATGVTQISDIYHLDRGYEGLTSKLQSLGAEISRVPCVEEKEVVFGC